MARVRHPLLGIAVPIGVGAVVATALSASLSPPNAAGLPASALAPALALALATLLADALGARMHRGIWRVSGLAWVLAAGVISTSLLAAFLISHIIHTSSATLHSSADPLIWPILGYAVFVVLAIRHNRPTCVAH